MSFSSMFADAIRQIGSSAAILRGGGRLEFPASVQPASGAPDEHTGALGWGVGKRYRLFAPASGNAASLERGDTVVYNSERYLVRWVQNRDVRGEAVYILAGLQMEGDGK